MEGEGKDNNIEWSDWFYYDETSPSCLRWALTRWANSHIPRIVVNKGDIAGYRRKDGYWVVKLFGDGYKVHRIVYELNSNNILGKSIIDHIDGDTNNNKFDNLRVATDAVNGKNKGKYKSNSTGVCGVHVNEKMPGVFYYVATWRNIDNTIGAKSFNINKLGEQEAFRLACEYRKKMIEELNAQGAGYTERHGT